MQAPLIRRATEMDVSALVDVCTRAAQQAYAPLVTAEYLQRLLAHFYGTKRITRELAPADGWFGYRVAQVGSDLVGVAGTGLAADRPQECELYALYVDPQHQGRGVGRALVEDAMSQAHDAGSTQLRVAVMPGNARAIAFYEQRGFSYAGQQPIYAPHGRDGGPDIALIYARTIRATRV